MCFWSIQMEILTSSTNRRQLQSLYMKCNGPMLVPIVRFRLTRVTHATRGFGQQLQQLLASASVRQLVVQLALHLWVAMYINGILSRVLAKFRSAGLARQRMPKVHRRTDLRAVQDCRPSQARLRRLRNEARVYSGMHIRTFCHRIQRRF